ncbi:MAG TPA: arginine--tRNA ligase, partial [Acidimicrobiales bacterium]|nr:arginine--tRNA ligase [Acidimicrobiales bacterium]
MADPISILIERFGAAIAASLGLEHAEADPVIRRSSQPQHGDFQANAAMALGKRVGRPPREIAEGIVARLDQTGVIAKLEIAGPGFVNVWLDDGFLASCVEEQAADTTLSVGLQSPEERVVIDYSSPNLAKEMQVHHLRSTIIGDALVRIFERLGHEVVKHNHFGDWGTQFGMLVEHLLEMDREGATDTSLADLNAFYKEANARFKDDEAFADRARQRVVRLQAGDAETVRLWQHFVTSRSTGSP